MESTLIPPTRRSELVLRSLAEMELLDKVGLLEPGGPSDASILATDAGARKWKPVLEWVRTRYDKQCPAPALGSEPNPADVVQLDDRLQRLLSELAPIDRQLVLLRLQGHGMADAARLLDVDAGLLRVRLGRLRSRLREDGYRDEWI